MATASNTNLDDKISTYRWFVAGMRYVVLGHVVALVFGALWFFTDAGLIYAAIISLALLGVGLLIIGRPSETALHRVPWIAREH
jgi:hypothetical protein